MGQLLMKNKKQEGSPKGPVIKIAVFVFIIVIMGLIWVYKNNGTQIRVSDSDNPDFSLYVTEALDLEQLKSYGLPILIDFGADSCVPCKEMAPILVKLNKEFQGKAIIKFVDVWKYQELSQGYPISIIPTQVFFDRNGKPYTPSDPQGIPMIMYSLKDTDKHVFTTHEGGMTEEMIRAVLKEMGVDK